MGGMAWLSFLTQAPPAPHSRGSLRDPALDRGAIHDYETCAHRALKKQSKTLISRRALAPGFLDESDASACRLISKRKADSGH